MNNIYFITHTAAIRNDANFFYIFFIISDKLRNIGSSESLHRLHNELVNKDWFMTLLDFNSYVRAKEQAFKDYQNRDAWAEKMITNIGKAGYFSSDRTIGDYNRDIWKLI